MSEIRFGPLPARAERYTRHPPIAAALRERPGEWARVAEYATAHGARHMAYMVRSGTLRAYEPAGAFEGQYRADGSAWALWARYTGGEGA